MRYFYPHESLSLPFARKILLRVLVFIARITFVWRAPRLQEGEFSRMKFLDKLYWVYKSQYPIQKGERFKNVKLSLSKDFLKESEITISGVGDLMQNPFLEKQSFSPYEKVKDLFFDVDFSFANLESPLTTQELKELVISETVSPSLAMPYRCFELLKGDGARNFNVMATACNHSFDFEAEGVETTNRILKEHGILPIGANTNKEESERGRVFEVNGVKLGLIAFTFGLNGHNPDNKSEYLVNSIPLNQVDGEVDTTKIKKQIDYLKNEKVDFIIASLHWGLEFEFFPAKRQVELAHRLAEEGIDLILGHHPHVIQPYEIYQTKRDAARLVPVFYSLGNLTNPFETPYMALSLLARINLVKGHQGGELRTYVLNVDAIPLIQMVTKTEDGIEILKLHECTNTDGYQLQMVKDAQKYLKLVL